MKKIMMTLAIALCSIAAFAGQPLTCAGEEEIVSQKVLNAFKTDFTAAKEVEWMAGDNYFKAAFVYNEKHVFAYYNTEGDLLGLTRYISPVDLPINLQLNLPKVAKGYWVSDLFEVAKHGTTSYYITLENADRKVVLMSTNGSTWEEFKEVNKV